MPQTADQLPLIFEIPSGVDQPEVTFQHPSLPSPLIGESDVKRLQAEGWAFSDGGLKLGNCWSCWAQRGEERSVFFLADPDKYPWAWSPLDPATSTQA